MNEKKFRETESKYKELKEKHARREISTEEVKEELKRLMVQDETGTYWMLGGKTGKWYRHDGAQWQETDPYEIIKAMKEAEEAPLELEASAQISEEQAEQQAYAQEEEREEEQEEKNPFDSGETDAYDTGNLSYPSFATEAAGTKAGSEEVEILESADAIRVDDTTVTADISPSSFAAETARGPGVQESPYTTVTADISSSPFTVKKGETAGAPDAAGIRAGSYGTESAGPPAGAAKARIDAGKADDSTYGSYDTFGTYEIDTTGAEAGDEEILIEKSKFADEDEALETKMESLDAAADEGRGVVDTQKFEYESSVEEEAEPLVTRKATEHEASLKPKTPDLEPQDYISCGVCKSRIPPFAIHCTFCGAHQKTLKQATSLTSIKEEGELLVKSIKIIPFLFFLGGLGLIVGVIVGATFGVVKDFLSELSPQLPMMLSETRGGIPGGLIFAAIGGIGGFILSAIFSTILASIYNFVAFIFGGIRFKVKR